MEQLVPGRVGPDAAHLHDHPLVPIPLLRASVFGPYVLHPPPYLTDGWGVVSRNPFWTDDTAVEPEGAWDIGALEFQSFTKPMWCMFHIVSILEFVAHDCFGWKKATPALGS